jgi:hypothetical protein
LSRRRRVVQGHPRRARPPPGVQRRGHHDAPQPTHERGRVLQLRKAAKRDEKGFLHAVARLGVAAEDLPGDGVGPLVRRIHEHTKRVEIARAGGLHGV